MPERLPKNCTSIISCEIEKIRLNCRSTTAAERRSMSNNVTITGSRAGDLSILAVIAGAMLLLAPRLRVYYQVTMVEVTVQRIAADGTRGDLSTPAEFQHVGDGYWSPETVVSQLRPKIEAYMNASPSAMGVTPGTQFDWTIRWSESSQALDHVEHVLWEAK
jgi:hypothetical protein